MKWFPVQYRADYTSSGLMVPMVNTKEDAEFVVKACKFPPIGLRGQGSPFSAWASSLSTPDYVQSANDSLLTMVQIETIEGAKNVEEIVTVDGVGESHPSHHPE